MSISDKDVNFGDLPGKYSSLEESAIVILPVPYEETSTWIKGAELKDPKRYWRLPPIWNPKILSPAVAFIATASIPHPPVEARETPESMVQAVYNNASDFLRQNKFVITLDVQHSISIGAIQAHFAHYPNLTVLQFDAHADMCDKYSGSKFNYAGV